MDTSVVVFDGGPDVPGAGLGAWVFSAGYLCLLPLITVGTVDATR
jgi:MFS transporter, MHS family, metabolite:H+ symporter